ncbi:TadE/TadG family type IV pilus assembly protein [Streptomyces sp. NPDC091267]|uniref:TadE/TadG family type IV pilus assembly protein n=1 Tax=Streptomyces sp. NPDC091267 TaxID=3155195 RepID=UPI00343D6AE5
MTRNRGRTRRERGQVAIEYMGFIPLLLLVGLFAVQLGVAAYTVNQAGTAARVAARTASHDRPERTPEDAGRASISDWLNAPQDSDFRMGWGYDEVTYTARLRIPSLVPGIDDWGWAERSSTMPRD